MKGLVEKLAQLEHEQWCKWSKAVADEVGVERRARWEEYWVPYPDLPEDVKEQDREWAWKAIEIVVRHPFGRAFELALRIVLLWDRIFHR